jgi:hypothetical protein
MPGSRKLLLTRKLLIGGDTPLMSKYRGIQED